MKVLEYIKLVWKETPGIKLVLIALILIIIKGG